MVGSSNFTLTAVGATRPAAAGATPPTPSEGLDGADGAIDQSIGGVFVSMQHNAGTNAQPNLGCQATAQVLKSGQGPSPMQHYPGTS